MQLDIIKHIIATEQRPENIKKKAVTQAEMIKSKWDRIGKKLSKYGLKNWKRKTR